MARAVSDHPSLAINFVNPVEKIGAPDFVAWVIAPCELLRDSL